MKFETDLTEGRLIRRYKRFLADVRLSSGEEITCVVGNTGSMLGLATPDSRVLLQYRPSKTRKYDYDWQMVEILSPDTDYGPVLVGINTGLPNGLAVEVISAGLLPTLTGYPQLARERKYGENSRIDILLTGNGKPDCYVEVKNVTLSRTGGLGEFPDAVTTRGQKHLRELANMVAEGNRAVMLYLAQRDDITRLELAADIDPAYAAAAREAADAGVEFLAIRCRMSAQEIVPHALIPVVLPD